LGCEKGEARKEVLDQSVRRELTDQANAEPFNPLFTRGVPLLPRIGTPPEYGERLGPGDKGREGLIAQGVAFTDGACKGFFRRTKRAGWGFIVRATTSPPWSMYGPCPDTYASALRAELWAIWALLRRTVPKIVIYTDNAEEGLPAARYMHAGQTGWEQTCGRKSGEY
jgi:hypothetical protein